MMGTNAMSPADVAAVVDNNRGYGYGDGMFGGGWMWIFVLLLLFRGNWGGYGNYGGESPLVSEEFIKRDIFNTNQNVSTSACQTQRDVLENRYTTQLGLQQVQAAQQQCCCDTQKEVLENRYAAALQAQATQAQLASCCCDIKTEGFKNTCDILNAVHAEGEATRSLIQSNTIQDLRDRLAERDRDLSAANFQISQVAQTSNIINTVRPFPVPAYTVQSPYVGAYGYGYGACGCNAGCGC